MHALIALNLGSIFTQFVTISWISECKLAWVYKFVQLDHEERVQICTPASVVNK